MLFGTLEMVTLLILSPPTASTQNNGKNLFLVFFLPIALEVQVRRYVYVRHIKIKAKNN